ncbi:MAG: hypothetical protein GJ678_06420 [Rhodobacteraceae bacterium]|nr:hypothetical protein [Paracoccaceae bacterium]
MRRRMADLLFAAVLLLMLPGMAAADRLTDSITDQLRSQGYGQIEVSRTFLGRYRIVASTDTVDREIIVNPGTGEILRDYIEDKGSERSGRGLFSLFDGGGSGTATDSSDSSSDDSDGDDGDGAAGGNAPGGHGAGSGSSGGGAGGGSGHGGGGESGDGDD